MSRFFATLLVPLSLLGEPSFEIRSSARYVVEQAAAFAGIAVNGTNPWDLIVHNEAFYNRVLKDQSLGLGESYMAGWWDSPALDQFFFHLLRGNVETQLKPTWTMGWAVVKAKLFNHQTKSKSLEVIAQHYQLGDDLYQNMLDETMTYSCGYWKNASSLAEAQKAKYDLIARKLNFQKGMRVLDIGCGWGGFAKYAAENYGVQVVAITLSEHQAAYARKVCANLPVEVRIQDYREMTETFDRIVEIGMFEHVGQKNYRAFMEMAHRCLTKDGLLMLHTIGCNTSCLTADAWVDRYIFPNGRLPSIAQIGSAIEGLFIMEDWHNFSADYDKTLMAWFANFDRNWHKIENLYSPTFYRMWKYYLLSFAGSFRARRLQLWQVVLAKEGVLGGYQRQS